MSTKESSNPSSPTQQPVEEKPNSTPQEEESSSLDKSPVDPSASDVDHSSEAKKETMSTTASNTDKGSTENNVDQAWTATWDANNQAYYWWNTITYETTWEDPFLKLDNKNKEEKEGKEEKDEKDEKDNEREGSSTTAPDTNFSSTTLPYYQQQQPQQQEYPDYAQPQDYTYLTQAHFNARTGKFQAASDMERLNPERMSMESRATRQMNYYFDVDNYTEQRNALGVSPGSKQRLSKKELNKYKKAKLEKKMKKSRDWLRD